MQRGDEVRMLDDVDLRCLIVDDNAQFRETATGVLRRQGVDVVGSAATIAEALQKGAELRPDLYLVDIDLGNESGFELARRIVARPALQPASVILTSSYSASDFAELIASCPAAGFVAKSQLSGAVLREMVGRAAAADEEASG